MRYYKEDIVLEQIQASIKLFFEGSNPIATQTLIHATKTLLEELDKKKGVNFRIETNLREDLTKEQRKDFFDTINNFPNFCKHSKWDLNEYIDTKMKLIEANEYLIYYCIRMYQVIYNRKTKFYTTVYLYYLSISGRYNFLFRNLLKVEPEIMKRIKKDNKEMGITKNNPNLKKQFYRLIQHYES